MIDEKPLVWIEGEVKSPPFSKEARIRAGFLLRQIQQGVSLSMPEARPMPSLATSCHELRIRDRDSTWRIIYSIEPEAIVILDVFTKKTRKTPRTVLARCKDRLQLYRSLVEEKP